MADPRGATVISSSIESEDVSSILHNLLQSSSAEPSVSPLTSFTAKHTLWFSSPPSAIATGDYAPQNDESISRSVTLPPDSKYRLSDLGSFFPFEARETRRDSFSSPDGADSNGFKVHKGSDVPEIPVRPRSLKRTRAAEIHNLSEKRRRSRINEKLKALQMLIPNSNKTDKASMLDEAIEYLKQLQLQVQILTMRNGLSLQPVYLQETLQPVHSAMEVDVQNRLLDLNGGMGAFPQNRELSIQSKFDISSHILARLPSVTNARNSDASPGLEPSLTNQYGLRMHFTPSKNVCRGSTALELHTDLAYSSKIPSVLRQADDACT